MVSAAPQQQVMFGDEPRVGEIDIKRKSRRRKPRKKPARAKTMEQVDYGRGVCELTTTLRSKIAYDSLDDRKKIGAIAHIAKERVTKKWCKDNKSIYLASGLSFSEWFLENKTSHDLAMKRWAKTFGWIYGWWNKSPVDSKPRMSDKKIVELLEDILRNNNV